MTYKVKYEYRNKIGNRSYKNMIKLFKCTKVI